MHPQVVASLVKGSSFPEGDRGGAACPGSGRSQRLQEQDRDKPAFSGAEGWGTEVRLAADLKAVAARSSATCDFLSHKSWPADLARLSEDTRSSLQSTAVTLLSPGAQIG